MILVTGATGYIGRHIVSRLADQDERPRCLVRDLKRATSILPAEKVDLVQGDTTQPDSLKTALQGVTTVIHTAFLTADHKETPGNHYDATNVQGTANLIEAAQAAGVQRIIEMSGLGTKPDQPGSYMQGRYLSEKMLMESGLQWTIIRPSVLFGKDAPFIKGLSDLIRTAPVLPLIGGGSIMFQPIYVEDVVTVVLTILADPTNTNNKVYTIGGPEQYSFREILTMLQQAMGKKRLALPVPLPLVGIGALGMETLLPRPPITRAALTLFSFDNITDLDSVSRDFDFTPRSFRDYLQEHGVS